VSRRLSFRLISKKDLAQEEDDFWSENSEQKNFISMATHQLRTPLAGIKWTLSMLLNEEVGPITKDQKKWLEQAFHSNEKLIHLTNEILSALKIDGGGMQIYPAPTDILMLVREVVEIIRPSIEKKGIRFKLEKGKGEIRPATIDRDRIVTVFQNLIENAIKYTPDGGEIKVTVTQEKDGIKCAVKDSGIGIPQADKLNIFRRFFRAHNAFNYDQQGTGLGLFISKGIIERHGGKIWFDSVEGRGTNFYFILPSGDIIQN